ncbi:MAG: rRNA processing protein RimM [Gammaproteobacteria bacterium]|jgi:16S rRNA processing protein RimM|nr:rRNA processing protein RimM [Gammaproteobacteria bacterium]
MATAQVNDKLIVVARIGAPHGVKGDLKLQVFSESTDILDFEQFYISLNKTWQPLSNFSIKPLGNQYVIHFNDCQDRDLAKRYVNAELAVPREELSELESGYYWTDLEGLKVVNIEGIDLGVVDHVMETGANDVLVLKGQSERLIPYIKHVIKKVDLANGLIVVDWGADY